MRCQIQTRKPADQITDRQQRNRASKCIDRRATKRCVFCGSKQNPRIHHLNGKEADNDPKNLVYACHAHNIKVGFLLKRFNIGQPVDREYNPDAQPAKSLAQWVMSSEEFERRIAGHAPAPGYRNDPGNVAGTAVLVCRSNLENPESARD